MPNMPPDHHEVFKVVLPIRWGDMDAFGHVNNTVYFRYAEQLRMEWLESTGLPLGLAVGQGPVIVTAPMKFRQQLRYPGNVVCTLFAGPPGRSSVETSYTMFREDDPCTLIANGEAKVVWVNYAAEKSVPLPDAVRSLLPAPSSQT